MTYKSFGFVLAFAALFTMISCEDYETYAEKKDREKSAINDFISAHKINVIDESTFYRNDSMTDASKNEYVLFDNTGVYMQIVRKGTGKKLGHKQSADLLCRFTEINLFTDSVSLSNQNQSYAYDPEEMTVYNSYGVFTASFTNPYGLMYSYYGQSVPAGWLVPLTFIKIGKQISSETEIAKVKLIVPAEQGHQMASANVNPYHYEITFEERDNK